MFCRSTFIIIMSRLIELLCFFLFAFFLPHQTITQKPFFLSSRSPPSSSFCFRFHSRLASDWVMGSTPPLSFWQTCECHHWFWSRSVIVIFDKMEFFALYSTTMASLRFLHVLRGPEWKMSKTTPKEAAFALLLFISPFNYHNSSCRMPKTVCDPKWCWIYLRVYENIYGLTAPTSSANNSLEEAATAASSSTSTAWVCVQIWNECEVLLISHVLVTHNSYRVSSVSILIRLNSHGRCLRRTFSDATLARILAENALAFARCFCFSSYSFCRDSSRSFQSRINP